MVKMNKKAQELSAHFGIEWFMQNVLLIILLLLILSVSVGFLLYKLTKF